MSKSGSTYSSVVTTVRSDACGPDKVTEIASVIRAAWRQGKTADLAKAMVDHPELRQCRSIVLELACDEYRFRLATGEDLSPEEFARR
jgi:hypothetical protein